MMEALASSVSMKSQLPQGQHQAVDHSEVDIANIVQGLRSGLATQYPQGLKWKVGWKPGHCPTTHSMTHHRGKDVPIQPHP